jgi:hypothetical protein
MKVKRTHLRTGTSYRGVWAAPALGHQRFATVVPKVALLSYCNRYIPT